MKTFLVIVMLLFGLQGHLSAQEPRYSVDAAWPQTLPNNWILGQVSGIAAGPDDSIWIVHRPRSISESEMGQVLNPPLAECCTPAPSVLQFDRQGTLLQAWGGPNWYVESQSWQSPEYDWPGTEHGIFVDHEGFVWLGGNGPDDHIVIKFTPAGDPLMTIGIVGETGGSNDPERLGRPADVFVDTASREVYIADGYLNRRVIVFDSDSGTYKRHWGAYGNRPEDDPLPPYAAGDAPAGQFLGPVHSVVKGPANRIYVSDRTSNRLQVFDTDGSFIEERILGPWTLANGSVWDMAFSPYGDGRWLFIADGQNMKIWILERESLMPVAGFGSGGRQAGQFDWVHNLAVDSEGNLYTSEVNNGRRIQKFVRQD